ncbi:MAG: HAMP domain-containing histidine kinase [Gemmatimonadetes bacterium]|nr:HAMP domain-containing histidine kinase [Gemmatimonadota bacterium]
MMMHEDSLSMTGADGAPRRVRMEWTGPDALAELERELGGFADVIALDRDVEVTGTDSTAVRRVTKSWARRGPGGDAEERIQLMFVEASAESGGTGMFRRAPVEEAGLRVNLPFFPSSGDARHVELIYPIAGLTDELRRTRRRSQFWLAGLLGIGAAAAVLVAVQFTRPIRSLQDSFERVENGDLSVVVQPERPDEIGQLTDSFNDMVSRLRETREIEQRLTESERLAALGTLAAGVAHEVRNPLNAMLLTLEQLSGKTAPPEGSPERARFDRYVANVTSELKRLERLVGTFLDLSRAERLADEDVDLGESLRTSVDLFLPEAEQRGVELTLEVPDGLLLRGDPERLRTVWNNLLRNAFESGTPTVLIRAARSGEELTVDVRDEGRGMDEETRGRVWEPFYSGRPDGTGLGMSLVRSIVEKHGGQAEVESTPGEGTTVRIRFSPGRTDASTGGEA